MNIDKVKSGVNDGSCNVRLAGYFSAPVVVLLPYMCALKGEYRS